MKEESAVAVVPAGSGGQAVHLAPHAAYGLAAEIRAVESGHNARLLADGSILVKSDSRPGSYRVWLRGVRDGTVLLGCTCRSGTYRESLPVPCKHAALAGRRLERHGLARWHEGAWRIRERAQVRGLRRRQTPPDPGVRGVRPGGIGRLTRSTQSVLTPRWGGRHHVFETSRTTLGGFLPSPHLGGGRFGPVTIDGTARSSSRWCSPMSQTLAPSSAPGANVGSMPSRVLLAEDDRATREALTRALELEGYQVRAVSDGSGVFEEIAEEPADVLVLDLMMPHVGGLTVCQRLRARKDRTPILIVTARTEVSDRVAGLDAGADDYLPKPFALDELLARVRALLRRASYDEPEQVLRVADLRMDEAARRAWRGERELELTKTEFDLLQLLVRNAGIVLSHSTIYERIWNYDFGPESKALSVYVGYLRRKTEAAGEARLLHTVRGVGYTLRAP